MSAVTRPRPDAIRCGRRHVSRVARITERRSELAETSFHAAGVRTGTGRVGEPPLRCIGLACAVLALALAPSAHALTLQDLDAGASFASSDGSLTFEFDPGSIVASGSLPGSLLDFVVTPVAGGFQIDGPLAAANGALAGLSLTYQVVAAPGLLLDGASLLVTGVAFGASAFATVGETLSDGSSLGVLVTGFGGSVPLDSAVLGAPAASLAAVTGAQLLAPGAGDVVAIQALRQTFALVPIPELETGLMLGLGLLGLALFGGMPGRGPAGARVPLRRRG